MGGGYQNKIVISVWFHRAKSQSFINGALTSRRLIVLADLCLWILHHEFGPDLPPPAVNGTATINYFVTYLIYKVSLYFKKQLRAYEISQADSRRD